MSRSSRRSRHASMAQGQRDDVNITIPRMLPRPIYVPPVNRLVVAEDRRTWSPGSTYRWAKTVIGTPARIRAKVRGRVSQLMTPNYMQQVARHIEFVSPRRVVVCVRRKIRKEVMHALGFAGRRGRGGAGPRRYTEHSNIHC